MSTRPSGRPSGAERRSWRASGCGFEYHEEQRGDYHNVYLDKVEPAPAETSAGSPSATGLEEAAWRTAVDAAPWLVGESDPHAKTPPEKLYETLKPFKDRVAEDIRESNEEQEPD